MAVTEVTNQSWGSRLGGSLKGIIFGFLLLVAAFPVLWMNEGRAVHRVELIGQAEQHGVSLDGVAQVDAAKEGFLVHATGETKTDAQLKDATFGIDVNAVHLNRSAEMYQWVEDSHTETKEKVGGGKTKTTTYTYKESWKSEVVDHTKFKDPDARTRHVNPEKMQYTSDEWSAKDVRLGAYRLSPDLIRKMNDSKDLALSAENSTLPNSENTPASYSGQYMYLGANAAQPQVGDIRISWKTVPVSVVTVLAKQAGESFSSWQPPKGEKALEQVLYQREMTLPEVIAQLLKENTILTWILRGVGLFLLYLGVRIMLGPLQVLAAVVPFVGRIVGFGLSIVAGLIAISFGSLTIALAWLAYRPLLGGSLLVVTVAGFFFIGRGLKKNKPAEVVPVQGS